jgi:GDP-D-mannose 3', 5'-epimerase
MSKNKHVLVTGGAGMIGSNLVAELLKLGHDVTVIDNFWRGSIQNLKETCKSQFDKVNIVIADLSCSGDWYKHFNNVDCVFHLADIVAGIGYVFSNEGYLFRKNLLINAHVTQAVSNSNVSRYIYVGTACSFPKELQNDVNAEPLTEEKQFPASPESAYGWSKLMGELDCKYLHEEKKIDTVVLSLHNVYGLPCDFNSSRSQVIPSLAFKTLSTLNNKIDVWGNGEQGRAFVNVKDVVNALVLSLENGHNVGVIQIGPDKCTTVREVAEKLVDIVNPSIKINYDLSKPTGDIGRCANYSKAVSELGWEPKVNLNDGLAELIDYISIKIKK